MKKHVYKRYMTWTDETFWGDKARNGGLVYGVYDHLEKSKVFPKPVGHITSYGEAQEEADKLNSTLEDPYTF